MNPRLAGHGLGQQGLAGARRAHQQRALRQLGADFRILLGVVEEVDDLHQGLLGLILAGHILEGDAGLALHVDLGVGFAQVADAAAHLAGHPTHQQGEDHHNEHHGQHPGQQHRQNGVDGLHIFGAEVGDAVLLQQRDKIIVPDACLGDGGAEVDQGFPAAGALGLILALDRLLLGGCPVQQGQVQHSAGGPALLGRLSGLTVLPALLRRADGHLSVLADRERVALLQREGVLAA